MITVYIITAIVGGVLILLSAFGGDHDNALDHDVDHDIDLSGDHDLDVDTGIDHAHMDVPASDIWIPFLSLRFWTYFSATSGVLGLLLRFVANLPEPLTAAIAYGVGLVVGVGVAYSIRYLQKNEVHSGVGIADLMYAKGKVMLDVKPGDVGKIRCHVKGDTIDLIALTEGDREIETGSEIVIVGIENNRAKIVSKDDW